MPSQTDIIVDEKVKITQDTNLVGYKGKQLNVNNPLPTDGDSVYAKDIWITESDTTGWSGKITDLVDNLHTELLNESTDNPKIILLHLNRTLQTSAIGLGCNNISKNFSNVKIILLGSAGAERTLVDTSSDNTKRNSFLLQFPPEALNAIRLEFHTLDPVCISNLITFKSINVNARLEAISELTNNAEDISSFRGALNTTQSLVHKVGINEHFLQFSGIISTFTVASNVGDYQITVTDGSLYTPGDQIKLYDTNVVEPDHIEVTAINGNILTLDRYLSKSFKIGDNVEIVRTNIAGQIGTLASPQSFIVKPPQEQRWQITRIIINMDTGNAEPDNSKFGSIANGISNGILIREVKGSGIVRNISNWKTNADVSRDAYDFEPIKKSAAGAYGMKGRWTFTKSQFIVDLDGDKGDYLEIINVDDLTATGLDNLEIKAQGRIFGE